MIVAAATNPLRCAIFHPPMYFHTYARFLYTLSIPLCARGEEHVIMIIRLRQRGFQHETRHRSREILELVSRFYYLAGGKRFACCIFLELCRHQQSCLTHILYYIRGPARLFALLARCWWKMCVSASLNLLHYYIGVAGQSEDIEVLCILGAALPDVSEKQGMKEIGNIKKKVDTEDSLLGRPLLLRSDINSLINSYKLTSAYKKNLYHVDGDAV